ncbi:MAG: endonuclease III [Spirochaetales bacterium]|nr:endonuclease III [Spirochaetales bacterium]
MPGSFEKPEIRDKTALARQVYTLLKKRYGPARCPLHYKKPHELAIAVILSAQCTDEQVNRVTPALFERFPEAIDYARAPLAVLERLIHSTGFFRNKARSIAGFARILVERYGGVLPQTIAELTAMPGIGRKTANVILGEIYGKAEGIVVDTHVKRISKLLGFTRSANPLQIERDLMESVPQTYWVDWSLYLIFLGRDRCRARQRICDDCVLNQICPSSTAQVRSKT